MEGREKMKGREEDALFPSSDFSKQKKKQKIITEQSISLFFCEIFFNLSSRFLEPNIFSIYCLKISMFMIIFS